MDIAIHGAFAATHGLFEAAFGGFRAERGSGTAPAWALNYDVLAGQAPGSWVIRRNGQPFAVSLDDADLVWMLDGDMAVELQRRRNDLYFVHAAVLEWRGRAFMVVGKSGAGKSVTAWAMVHEGFGYLSDEMAPVDLEPALVHPYPRALCFKDETGWPPVPAAAARTERSIHVPTSELPTRVWRQPLRLSGVFFLGDEPRPAKPSLRAISPGETAARTYRHVLNALAHPASGLDAATRLARACPGFIVGAADLRATAALLRQAADAAA